MEREILFRGKRTDNGEWVTGTPFIFEDRCKMIQAVAVHPDFVDEGNVYYSEGFPVDLETVGQFTGLFDKNRNRIFEGDIVDILTENEEIGIIAYDEGGFLVNANGFCVDFHANINGTDLEVIGNIHDNPELLNGKES